MADDEIVTGSLTLSAKEEQFARMISSGTNKVAAFKSSFPGAEEGIEAGTSSLRSRAHRLAKNSGIAARIHYLRQERERCASKALPERWTAVELSNVAKEATQALTAALRACEADASVPEAARAAVRREAVRHAGRVARAGAAAHHEYHPDFGTDLSSSLADALGRLQLCACEGVRA